MGAGRAPDGQELWDYLQTEDYDTEWSLWPGRGELYEGTEPHGMLLTTYVNDVAREALEGGANALPAGAIVVKENYMPAETLAVITTMYKVEGFDPAVNDWFWLRNTPDGTIEAEGQVSSCSNCHAGAADFDYLWLLQQDRTGS